MTSPDPAGGGPAPARAGIDRLLAIMARLRDPAGGCPWDLEQRFETIAPYTIEEAYEVADAIASGDPGAIRDELGDLLLQVVFQAQIARDAGLFDFDQIAQAIADKMVARHPHVFGPEQVADAAAMVSRWEDLKAAERDAQAAAAGRTPSILDGVALGLPALMRAQKLQKRAARVGFDWTEPHQILDKLEEELAELRAVLPARGASAPDAQAAIAEELGDLMFVLVNLARHHGLDAEAALRGTNAKFTRRFRAMETAAMAQGTTLAALDLDAQEALWQAAKVEERRTKVPKP